MAGYLLGEVYELIDAVGSGSLEEIRDELGDVLFQVLFIVRIFEEEGRFDLGEVVRWNARKMIHRHPHVFGSERAETPEAVKARWQELKAREKPEAAASLLDGLTGGLPALLRAAGLAERLSRVDPPSGAPEALERKLGGLPAELREAVEAGSSDGAGAVIGRCLLTLVRLAGSLGVDPETALLGAARDFEGRIRSLEERLAESGRGWESVTPEEREGIEG